MSQTPCCYEIRVAEPLERHWLAWLAELGVSRVDRPQPACAGTLLRAHLADQAAVYGLLGRLRDLNLHLLEVRQVECSKDAAEAAD